MLDFSDTGDPRTMVIEQAVAAREATIGHGGCSGPELAQASPQLRANDLIWPYVVNGYLKGTAARSTCCSGTATTPTCRGPMYCWYLRNTYLREQAARAGRHGAVRPAGGSGQITVPAFVYASRGTTSCPGRPPTPAPGCSAVTCASCSAPGPHRRVINPPAKGKRNHWSTQAGRRRRSLARTRRGRAGLVGGLPWMDWLGEHAGRLAAAPKSAGSRQHKPSNQRPAAYVKAKAPRPTAPGSRPVPIPGRRNLPCKTSSSFRAAHRGRQVRRLDRQHPATELGAIVIQRPSRAPARSGAGRRGHHGPGAGRGRRPEPARQSR